MVEVKRISAGDVLLELVPSMGGGIARLDVAGCPVLRPWNGNTKDPFSLASNVLVPFSNRISRDGFDWDGIRHDLTPNLPGEACPIHGDGFQKPWSFSQFNSTVRMTLENGAFGPWRYKAVQDLALTETSLTVKLSVTNTGSAPLPFGCGFHPWFPRNADTRLSFDAETVWMEDASYLPTKELSLSDTPDWDFAQSRPLPATWINNGYTNWRGPARIDQGDGAISCNVTASDNLNTALVFSPDATAGFFCFEPVSHPVDAFHLRGHPGLRSLNSGETMRAGMTISWSATERVF